MSNAPKIRIVAAVVDTAFLTLYKDNGESIQIPQGDLRVRPLITEVTPLLISQGYADVSLAEIASPNHYAEFEEQSKGMVKFFRVAKDKLKKFFSSETKSADTTPVPVLSVGSVPAIEQMTVTKAMSAVDSIMEHAVPASHIDWHERTVAKQGNVVEENGLTSKSTLESDSPDTIVAMVGDQIIPGMEKIKTQFVRANKLGSTVGVTNFLKRLGAVIDQRKHSVDDLLKFMERADTPIADDGSIIIYKVLSRKEDRTNGRYVDCHTGKVEQWTGAYVCMDPSLVDPNRSNECSNGLHVARRGYIREFSGNVCVLAKLAPEDVIAVPSYDANKMRVCGYHILMELSDAQYNLLKNNKPLTDDVEGQKLLAQALAGKHVRKTHEVRITGQKGTDVIVKALFEEVTKATIETPKPVVALENPVNEIKDKPVDPKAVMETVTEVKLSRKEQAAQLYADHKANKPGALEALVAMQKAAKVGWDRLGVPNPMVTSAKTVETKKETVPTVSDKRVVNGVELGEGSSRERIQKMLSIGLTSIGVAKAIMEIKKKSKKSWAVLGVSETQVAAITKLANHQN